VASDDRWHSIYAVLRGTQLELHRVKTDVFPADNHKARPGKLIRSFTLQHAEVGIALDTSQADVAPKYKFVRILPSKTKEKLLQKNPLLFYLRQWMIRLRVEGEQYLLSFEDQDTMLNWIENLCAAIDIAPPLEDRSDARYRSLPRRTRRQRQLEREASEIAEEGTDDADNIGQRLITQQARLLQRMYPNLANDCSEEAELNCSDLQRDAESGPELEHVASNDPDADDLDPADVAENPATETCENESHEGSDPDEDSKFTSRAPHSASTTARFRRRCAPVLHKTSPRSSDIIIVKGQRMKVDARRELLVPFELLPPRYARGAYKRPDRLSRATEEILVRSPSRASTAADARVSENEQDVASVLGLDTSDTITPTETIPSRHRGELSQINSSDSAIIPLKEKTASLLKRRQNRADEDAARIFAAGVVCWGL
jgi:hypothetical protein